MTTCKQNNNSNMLAESNYYLQKMTAAKH